MIVAAIRSYLALGGYLPRYQKWPSPLADLRCRLEKAEVLTLPTLALDEAKISDIIEIVDSYIKILDLTPEMVDDKLVPLKEDYLTVRNLRLAVNQSKFELRSIDRYQWIEPVAGLFHLGMNVPKVTANAFWGSVTDPTSLSRLNNVLARVTVDKKCSNFQQSHDFFRTVIDALVIALCIEDLSLSNISELKDWLAHHDWRRLIERVVEHVGPFATNDIREKAASKTENDVETALVAKKAAWAAAHP